MDQEFIYINLENLNHGFWDGLTMSKYDEPLQHTSHPMTQTTIDV